MLLPKGPGFVHVTDDPEKAWARIAPARALRRADVPQLADAGAALAGGGRAENALDELKASGVYRVVTPDECVALAEETGTLVFHPLMGGIPADLGWESLELFASKVLPRLS